MTGIKAEVKKGGADGAAANNSASSKLSLYNNSWISAGANYKLDSAYAAHHKRLEGEAAALMHRIVGKTRSLASLEDQEAEIILQRQLQLAPASSQYRRRHHHRLIGEEEGLLEGGRRRSDDRHCSSGGGLQQPAEDLQLAEAEAEEEVVEEESWELVRAFAGDVSRNAADMEAMMAWPPRSYNCAFCRREFRSAQALGGHMNVHRRDRARLRRQSPPPGAPTHYNTSTTTTTPPPQHNHLYPSLSTLLHNLSSACTTGPNLASAAAPADHIITAAAAPAYFATACPTYNISTTGHAAANSSASPLSCLLYNPFALSASALPSPTSTSSSSPTLAPAASSTTTPASAIISPSCPSLTLALNFPSPLPPRPAPPSPPGLNLQQITSLHRFLNPASNPCISPPSSSTNSSGRSSWTSRGRCSSIANSSDLHSTILPKSPRPIKRLQTGAFQPYHTIKLLQKASCADSNTATLNIIKHDNPPDQLVVPHGASVLDLELRLGQ